MNNLFWNILYVLFIAFATFGFGVALLLLMLGRFEEALLTAVYSGCIFALNDSMYQALERNDNTEGI